MKKSLLVMLVGVLLKTSQVFGENYTSTSTYPFGQVLLGTTRQITYVNGYTNCPFGSSGGYEIINSSTDISIEPLGCVPVASAICTDLSVTPQISLPGTSYQCSFIVAFSPNTAGPQSAQIRTHGVWAIRDYDGTIDTVTHIQAVTGTGYDPNAPTTTSTTTTTTLPPPTTMPPLPPTTTLPNPPKVPAKYLIDEFGNIIDEFGNIISADGNPKNCEDPCNPSVGQPVNIVTGSMWHNFIDISVKGRSPNLPLEFKRTYLSQSVDSLGEFGPNWMHNWETRILAASSEASPNLVWIDQSGGSHYFKRAEDNTLINPPGFFGSLVEESGMYILTAKRGIRYIFSRNSQAPIGRLIKMSEPHGEEINLIYQNEKLSSISTALAGSIVLSRNANGQIIQAYRQRDNLQIGYSYADGKLASSSDVDGNITSYSYGVDHNLLGVVTDPLNRKIYFSYDAKKRVTKQTDFGGASWDFTYFADINGGSKTVVKGLDKQNTVYHFNSRGLLLKEIYPDNSSRSYTWTNANRKRTSTDELGLATEYGYDEKGNLTSVRRPLDPAPTLTNHNQIFDIPERITPLVGAPTNISLNAQGDITQIQRVGAEGIFGLDFTYDQFGQRLSTNNGIASYANQTNANGLLSLVFDSRNPETRNYDTRARLVQRNFQSGRVLKYNYDNKDRVTKIEDSHGPDTILGYDVLGRVISRNLTDGVNNQITKYQWDARDRLISKMDPLGNVSLIEYDLGGAVIDKPAVVEDALGRKSKYVYDSRQRLSQIIDAKGSITKMAYNKRGDLIAVTDANNNVTTFVFDGNQRLISKVSVAAVPKKGSAVLKPGQATNYTYDIAGKLIREDKISVDLIYKDSTLIAYDSFDRVVRKVEQKFKNNVLVSTSDDSQYGYLPILEAEKMTFANNQVQKLNFGFEALPPFASSSFEVKATDPSNALKLVTGDFQVQRDITGEIGAIVNQQNKAIIETDYDPAGRAIQVGANHPGSAQSLKADFSYDSFGRKSKLVFSDKVTGNFSYDSMDRISHISWSKKDNERSRHRHHDHDHWECNRDRDDFDVVQALVYDKVGNIVSQRREQKVLTYGYDSIDQILSVSIKLGSKQLPVRKFEYDKTGNTLKDTENGNSQFIANQLIKNSDIDYVTDDQGFGRLIKEKDHARDYLVFSYRVDDKLESVINDEKEQTTYYYDALGRRVAKKISKPRHAVMTQTYLYSIDQDKILMGKSGDGKLTVYMDGQGIDEHLGQVKMSSVKSYMTDHLGSVLNSQIAGKDQEYDVLGESSEKIRDISKQSDPVIYGFTGRQFDPESQKYYYRARMYDPEVGRFMTKDPIGFLGGDANLYRYVGNRFLNATDPLGLIIKFNDLQANLFYQSFYNKATSEQKNYLNNIARDSSTTVTIGFKDLSGRGGQGEATNDGNGGIKIFIDNRLMGGQSDPFNLKVLAHEFGHVDQLQRGQTGLLPEDTANIFEDNFIDKTNPNQAKCP